MNFVEWSKSSVDYGHKLVNSAIVGAREGEDEFLREEPLAPYLGESARNALRPALIGAYLGALAAGMRGDRRPLTRTLALGLLGGAIGFSAGVLWENRELSASVASNAWKRINAARDEHWFEKNPIDYA